MAQAAFRGRMSPGKGTGCAHRALAGGGLGFAIASTEASGYPYRAASTLWTGADDAACDGSLVAHKLARAAGWPLSAHDADQV
jgi:hypothetical protein